MPVCTCIYETNGEYSLPTTRDWKRRPSQNLAPLSDFYIKLANIHELVADWRGERTFVLLDPLVHVDYSQLVSHYHVGL